MCDFDVLDYGNYYYLSHPNNGKFDISINKNDASLDKIKEIANSLYPCYGVIRNGIVYTIYNMYSKMLSTVSFEQLIEFIKINNAFNISSITRSCIILVGIDENEQKKYIAYPIEEGFAFDDIKSYLETEDDECFKFNFYKITGVTIFTGVLASLRTPQIVTPLMDPVYSDNCLYDIKIVLKD